MVGFTIGNRHRMAVRRTGHRARSETHRAAVQDDSTNYSTNPLRAVRGGYAAHSTLASASPLTDPERCPAGISAPHDPYVALGEKLPSRPVRFATAQAPGRPHPMSDRSTVLWVMCADDPRGVPPARSILWAGGPLAPVSVPSEGLQPGTPAASPAI